MLDDLYDISNLDFSVNEMLNTADESLVADRTQKTAFPVQAFEIALDYQRRQVFVQDTFQAPEQMVALVSEA